MTTLLDSMLGNNSRGRSDNRRGSGGDSRRSYKEDDYQEPVCKDGYRVLSIRLIETGTYNPEYLRPYSISADSSDMDAIADIALENGRGGIDATAIAGVAGRIMRYSSEVSQRDLVNIENGWNERRLAFQIEVIEEATVDYDLSTRNSEVVTSITGFTDRFDIADRTGKPHLPDDLTFYVSNIHRIERETRRITANHQLIFPNYHNNGHYGTRDRNQLYLVRPKDIFQDQLVRERTPRNAERVNASNTLTGVMPKTSRVSNLSPASYIASSVNAMIRGETQRGVDDGFGNFTTERRIGRDAVYTRAASLLSEETAYANNSFMYLLRGRSNSFNSRSTFDWGDLIDIFGRELPRVVSIYKRKTVSRNENSRGRWSEAGQCASWDDNESGGYNAVFATALKQALPGYALVANIGSCRIEATNMVDSRDRDLTYGGIMVTIDDVIFTIRPNSLMEEDLLIEQFKEQVAYNILRDVSLNNTIDFDVVVELDWRHDTFVNVGIEGGEMVEFSTAGFTNSLTSPIITTDDSFAEDMAADIKNVVNNIMGNR